MFREVALRIFQIQLRLWREHITRIPRRQIRVAPPTEPVTAILMRELRCMNQEFLGKDALPRSHAMETDLSLNACQKYE